MTERGYDRQAAVDYAHNWAFRRNTDYYNFDNTGGDCTDFASQCIYAGCKVMNYAKDVGWYYRSSRDRAAAWSGVPYLYNFLTANTGVGPYGKEVDLEEVEPGDIVQFNLQGEKFEHSTVVVSVGDDPSDTTTILVCAHTKDSENRAMSDYRFVAFRVIHILGCRE